MVLNIVSLVLILGITFLNSIYGFFSGIINLFCTIVSLAVTFGFWAPLNAFLTSQGLHPSYSTACAFVLLFLVSTLVLRSIADAYIRGNVRVPLMVDWIGGGLCGFLIAELTVGTLLLGFLMLPFGGPDSIYARQARSEGNRKDADKRTQFETHSFWLSPDYFATYFAMMLSRGTLSGGVPLESVYPDFPQWVFWTGNTVQEESMTAPARDRDGDGFKDGFSAVEWWVQTSEMEVRYRAENPSKESEDPNYERQTYQPRSGLRLLGVRVALTPAAGDRGKHSSDHRFRPTQFRLVGTQKYLGEDKTFDYVPRIIGGADPKVDDNFRLVDIDNDFCVPAEAETKFDLYFEVPEDFRPRFIEYRRFARIAVTDQQLRKAPPEKRLAVRKPGTGADQASGMARFIDAVLSNTGDEARLPFEMKPDVLQGQSGLEVVRVEGEPTFSYGRLTGDRKRLETKDNPRVSRFKNPDGKRVFTLETKARQAESLAGGVFNYVGGKTNQYFAIDKSGDRYPLMGYYAVVTREGEEYVEMFLVNHDDEAEVTAFRSQLDFQEIKLNELQADDARLGLLFFVPKGKCITKISNQAGQGIEFGNEYCVRTF